MLIDMRNGLMATYNEEDYTMVTQITVTQNCTNTSATLNHLQTLLNNAGIESSASGVIKLHTDTPRYNAILVYTFLYRTMQNASCIRYRNGTAIVPVSGTYDADVRIGDVYDVYVLKKTEEWES